MASPSAYPAIATVDDLTADHRDAERRALAYLTGFGGQEQMLARHLARSRRTWSVSVLTETGDSAHKLQRCLPPNAHVDEIVVHPAHPPLRGARGLRAIAEAWRVAVRLRGPLDLVSAGDLGSYHLVTAWLAVLGRLPPVYAPMPPPEETVATWVARRSIRTLVTISDAIARDFRHARTIVLPNLAPGHLTRLAGRRSADSSLHVYWVGRLEHRQKNPACALRILSSVPRQQPSVEVHLHVVGDGPCLVELQEQARRLGITRQVHFWGWVDFEQTIPDALPPIHALLNTSDFEGVPLTLLDARELGIPCLFRRGVVRDSTYREGVLEWDDEDHAARLLVEAAARRRPA